MYEGDEGLWWWVDGEDSPIEYSLTDYYEEQLSQLSQLAVCIVAEVTQVCIHDVVSRSHICV